MARRYANPREHNILLLWRAIEKKVAFRTDIGKGEGVTGYVSEEEVKSAKELIEKAIFKD